jgi:hypothetical protein
MHRISRRNKDRAQKIHFLRRFVERVGYVPDKVTIDEMLRQIREGEAVPLYDQSLRVKIKGIKVNGKNLVVVYDRSRGTLVSVLPMDSAFYQDLELAYETNSTN